jgi:hypothetical protein
MGFGEEMRAAAVDIVGILGEGTVTLVIPVPGALDPVAGTRASTTVEATLPAVVHGLDARRSGGIDAAAAGRVTFAVERAALEDAGITPKMITRNATLTRDGVAHAVHAVLSDHGFVRLECSKR